MGGVHAALIELKAHGVIVMVDDLVQAVRRRWQQLHRALDGRLDGELVIPLRPARAVGRLGCAAHLLDVALGHDLAVNLAVQELDDHVGRDHWPGIVGAHVGLVLDLGVIAALENKVILLIDGGGVHVGHFARVAHGLEQAAHHGQELHHVHPELLAIVLDLGGIDVQHSLAPVGHESILSGLHARGDQASTICVHELGVHLHRSDNGANEAVRVDVLGQGFCDLGTHGALELPAKYLHRGFGLLGFGGCCGVSGGFGFGSHHAASVMRTLRNGATVASMLVPLMVDREMLIFSYSSR